MNRLPLLLAALVAATIALPAVAQGATLERLTDAPNTVELLAAPNETNLISVEDRPGSVLIRDDAQPLKLKRALGCLRVDSHSVRCFFTKRVWIDMGDRNDHASIATRREVGLGGGAGDDRYIAVGTDKPSRVDFFGGFGNDTANYHYATEGVRVGVDGMPFDGRPGDNDRIDNTTETVFGSMHDDVLTGASREQSLFGFDGDDVIAGGAHQDALHGGPGHDRIDARDGELDTIDCGGNLWDQLLADPVESSILGCP
jgi:RTX calcium-binding nonapeptide repeat (4 copies)